MKVEDVRKINWKQSPGMVAVQERLAKLEERATRACARVEELSQMVREGDQLLLQARAAEMLGESPLESVEMIQRRLKSARHETADLHATLGAVDLAKAKLAPAVRDAQSAAKLEVGVVLAPVYQKATEELRELLAKAAAVWALGFPVALNFLGLPGGKPSEDLARWHDHIDKVYGAN